MLGIPIQKKITKEGLGGGGLANIRKQITLNKLETTLIKEGN